MRARGRPTVVDVAADAGVSLKTVSRVINGVTTVAPDLAARVHASIEHLGFRRDLTAANLRAGTSTTIGLITADLANPFYTALASSISAFAVARSHQVIMASTDEDAAAERRLALDLCGRRIGGLILVPSAHDQGYLEPETRAGRSVVFLDRPGAGIEADAVLLDNRGGARDGVLRLLAAGHRRIAFLFDSLGIYTMATRLAGARQAFADSGLAWDESLLAIDAHSPSAARAAMSAMLRTADPPTAVFCANNRATIGAVEAIADHGAAVEVVGFDDFEFSRLLPFEVTIVGYDTAGMGTAAAELLFRRMSGQHPAIAEHLIPTRLVRRGRRVPRRHAE